MADFFAHRHVNLDKRFRGQSVGVIDRIAPAEAAAGRRQSLAAGEQTVSVFLADLLGYSWDEIGALKDAKVIP